MRVKLRKRTGVPLGEFWQLLTRFRPALRGQQRNMTVALAAALGGTIATLLRPWPVTWIVDRIVDDGAESLPVTATLAAAAVAFLVPAMIGLAGERQEIAVAQVSRKATVRIRSDLFEHLQRVEMAHHSSLYNGDLQVRLMGDVNMVRDLLFPSWVNMIARSSLVVIGSIVFIAVDWRLWLIALVPMPFLWLTVDRGARAVRKAAGKQRRKEGAIAASAGEQLRQVGVIKAFAAEERTNEAFRAQSRSAERATMAATREAARVARLTEVLTGAGVALVLLVGIWRVRNGGLTIGQLVLVISYTRMLYKPIRKLTAEGTRLAKAAASARRVIEILDLPLEDRESGVPISGTHADIVFDDVHHVYEDGRQSLDGVSFRIPAGSLTAVVGDNGAGKSTVLSLLLRLYAPSAGSITIGGFHTHQLQLESFRRQIAFVPQRLALFSGTIRDNIVFGNPGATDDEIAQAVRAAHLEPVLADLPDGIETVLAEEGVSLSGGQARRVMLARAAVRDASILLLDEPFAGLDVEARRVVAAAIRSIARGRTTVVVHHGDLAQLAPDHVIDLGSSDPYGTVDLAESASQRSTSAGQTSPDFLTHYTLNPQPGGSLRKESR